METPFLRRAYCLDNCFKTYIYQFSGVTIHTDGVYFGTIIISNTQIKKEGILRATILGEASPRRCVRLETSKIGLNL